MYGPRTSQLGRTYDKVTNCTRFRSAGATVEWLQEFSLPCKGHSDERLLTYIKFGLELTVFGRRHRQSQGAAYCETKIFACKQIG